MAAQPYEPEDLLAGEYDDPERYLANEGLYDEYEPDNEYSRPDRVALPENIARTVVEMSAARLWLSPALEEAAALQRGYKPPWRQDGLVDQEEFQRFCQVAHSDLQGRVQTYLNHKEKS